MTEPEISEREERQAIFDTVWDWFVVQNRPRSVMKTMESKAKPTGACVYRSDEGNRCAVGVLITDDEYMPEFEGFGVYDFVNAIERVKLNEYADPDVARKFNIVATALAAEKYERFRGFIVRHRAFLAGLQDTHDVQGKNATHLSDLALRAFATAWGVKVPGDPQPEA